MGCINKHPTRQEAFNYGYKMGLTDGSDQVNYVGTGGLKGHSKAFTAGYNEAFGNGDNSVACKPYYTGQ